MSTGSRRSDYENSTRGFLFAGVTGFAGVMLMTVGVFQILEGIAAIADDKVYVTGIKYAYQFDVTAWGWIHLIVGIIALATGFGLLVGQTWARLTGILIAVIGAVANFAFLPYYPFWSVAIIAFNIFVIWAIATQMTEEA
jgi:hypothetical protein